MRLVRSLILFGLGASVACAQQTGPNADERPSTPPTGPSVAQPAPAPAPATPPAVSADPEVAAIQKMVVGSFHTKGEADEPALSWNAAVVTITGLDNAVYFEVSRRDDAANPFRSGILHVFRRQGQLRLRVFDFTGQPTFKDAVVGLWLAPAAFPKASVDQLRPQVDLVQQMGSGAGIWVGASANPVPTMRGGAVEMTSEISLRPDAISVADRGIDAAGKQVWGPGTGKSTVFTRGDVLGRVDVQPSGLVILTLMDPAATAPKLVDGGTVVMQYTGHLPDGVVFDTSRQEGRQAFRVTVPANIPPGINQGVMGIGTGERRRLVIPSALAYGEAGSRAGRVPPNSTLYFDIECLVVELPPAPAAAPVPAPADAPTAPTGK